MELSATDSIHVLHVDDDSSFAALASEALENASTGITVETATSASAGLDELAERRYDCVVSDYEMPETSGIEFLRAVRETYPDLPFVLFTGDTSEAVASEAISAGVTDYQQKTTGNGQYTVLANRIRNAVEQYRATRAVRQRERELERERDRLSTLFENLPSPSFAYAFDGDRPSVTRVNEAFVETFGYGPEEAVGERPDELLVAPDGREHARSVSDRLRAGEPVDEIVRADTAGGVQRFSVRNIPVSDGETDIDGYAVYVDSTAGERERELERYKTVVEASGDPVYTLDADGKFSFINNAFCEMTGYDQAELLGAHFVSLLPRSDRLRAETVIRSVWDSDTDRRTSELTVVRQDGSEIPCEIHITPFPTAETDEFRGNVGVIRDISDRKARERRLRRQRDRLERQNDRLDEFADVVSHDLRNPLNVLCQSLELVDADDDEHLDRCHRAVDRMDQLIDDLLTLARQGEAGFDPEPLDVAEVATDCWETVRSSSATLDVETDLTVEADEGRFKQLLENLFRNAIEHGGSVEELTVGSVEGGFYVMDDGAGIPEPDRADVFDSGFSTTHEGTGLGLSIVRQAAEAHDWEVEITETEAGGARFEITGVTAVE